MPHINSTKERLKEYREEQVVLVVQDTSTQKYWSNRERFSIAFTTGGVPLGFINLKIWIREEIGTSKDRKKKQIEKKESYL